MCFTLRGTAQEREYGMHWSTTSSQHVYMHIRRTVTTLKTADQWEDLRLHSTEVFTADRWCENQKADVVATFLHCEYYPLRFRT